MSINNEKRTVYDLNPEHSVNFGNLHLRTSRILNHEVSFPCCGLKAHWYPDLNALQEIDNWNLNLNNIQFQAFPTFMLQNLIGRARPQSRSFLNNRIRLSLPYTEHMLFKPNDSYFNSLPASLRSFYSQFYLGKGNAERAKALFNNRIEQMISQPAQIVNHSSIYLNQENLEGSGVLISPNPPIFDEVSLNNAMNWQRIVLIPMQSNRFTSPLGILLNLSYLCFNSRSGTQNLIDNVDELITEIYGVDRFPIKPEFIFIKVLNEESLIDGLRLEHFKYFISKLVEIAKYYKIFTILTNTILITVASLFEGIDAFIMPTNLKQSFNRGGGRNGRPDLSVYGVYHYQIYGTLHFGDFREIIRQNNGIIPYLRRIREHYDINDLDSFTTQNQLLRFRTQAIGESANQMIDDLYHDIETNSIQAAKLSLMNRNSNGAFSRFLQ